MFWQSPVSRGDCGAENFDFFRTVGRESVSVCVCEAQWFVVECDFLRENKEFLLEVE